MNPPKPPAAWKDVEAYIDYGAHLNGISNDKNMNHDSRSIEQNVEGTTEQDANSSASVDQVDGVRLGASWKPLRIRKNRRADGAVRTPYHPDYVPRVPGDQTIALHLESHCRQDALMDNSHTSVLLAELWITQEIQQRYFQSRDYSLQTALTKIRHVSIELRSCCYGWTE